MKKHNDWFCPQYRATVLPDENGNCSLCSAGLVPLHKSTRYITSEDEARELAIDWQQWSSEQDMSWGELAEWSDLFRKLARKFNLTEEFKENAII